MTNGYEELFMHNGIKYRMVKRKGKVGDMVLANDAYRQKDGSIGTVFEVVKSVKDSDLIDVDGFHDDDSVLNLFGSEYYVLEPVEPAMSQRQQYYANELLTADENSSKRELLDLIANLARRLTDLERKHEAATTTDDAWAAELDERIDRLASANEQAINLIARNVERQAQELEALKYGQDEFYGRLAHVEADVEEERSITTERSISSTEYRRLTAEERRSL